MTDIKEAQNQGQNQGATGVRSATPGKDDQENLAPVLPPLWEVRHDGSRYPNRGAEDAILGMVTDADAPTSIGFERNQTLGDLLVDLLAPDLVRDVAQAPQEWESIEHAFIVSTAREIRAVILAREAVKVAVADDDYVSIPFDDGDTTRMLDRIQRRMTAGAELMRRLRHARWGNPHFGGGETVAAESKSRITLKHVGNAK
jgi:hypothetical protein